MKNRNVLKISFTVLLALSTSIVFAQKDEKELSLDFASYAKNAQYHQAYAMLDTSASRKVSEEKFIATWRGITQQVGTIEDYSFTGMENIDGKTRTHTNCHFQKMTLDLNLGFNSSRKIIRFTLRPVDEPTKYIAPVYDSAKNYTEKQITVTTGKYQMPGILTIPNNVKNPPVIVFVHGSGAGDKDESVGGNKTFRDLAVGFASEGIATIRYDKRTKVYGAHVSDDIHNFTVKEETMDDAISAVNMVGGLGGVDSNRIYLLGHSLGAMLAPRMATESKKIKGIIMMAGPARSLEDVVIEQFKYGESLDTTRGDEKKQVLAREIKMAEFTKNPDLKPNTPDSLLLFNSPAPYWIDLNHYNQVKVAQELTIPILILQGENDCQVSMLDYNIWKEKLDSKKNVTLKSYPKQNHLFVEYEGKSTGAEYEKPGNVPFYVINDIANWVNKK